MDIAGGWLEQCCPAGQEEGHREGILGSSARWRLRKYWPQLCPRAKLTGKRHPAAGRSCPSQYDPASQPSPAPALLPRSGRGLSGGQAGGPPLVFRLGLEKDFGLNARFNLDFN